MLGGLVEEVDSLQELGVKENFFKNALNEEAHVDSLLAYYRERVAGLERERHDWLKRYEMVRPRPEDEHRREWDARQSKDAIGLLQKDLSDARQRLFEERQKILKAQAEQTQLKKKLQLDADVAQTLLQNCSAVEHKVLLTSGNKPTVVSKYVNNDLNLKQADKRDKGASKQHKQPVMKPNERIYTILGLGDSTKGQNTLGNLQNKGGLTTLTPGSLNPDLSPEELAQRAAAEADFYHSQLPPAERELERRKAQLSGVVRFLTEEYTEKERRYNLEVLETLAKIDNLSEGTLKNEKLICDLNKEILKQRIAFEQKQLELSHANEALRRENVETANHLASTEMKLTGDKRAIERGIAKDCDKRAGKFRTRARESGEQLDAVQRRYKEMKDKHKEHTKQLEKQLIELKDKHSTIKRKKEIELSTAMRDWEAAASLVQPCQQAVASADHLTREDKEARIQKLAELLLFSKDRLDAVLRPRRTKQKSVQKKSLQGKRSQSREVQKKKRLNKPVARGALGDPSDQPLKFPQDSVQGRPSDGYLEGAEEMQGGEEATNEEHQDEEYAAEGEEEQYYDGMEENLPEPEHFGGNRPGARPQSAAGGRR